MYTAYSELWNSLFAFIIIIKFKKWFKNLYVLILKKNKPGNLKLCHYLLINYNFWRIKLITFWKNTLFNLNEFDQFWTFYSLKKFDISFNSWICLFLNSIFIEKIQNPTLSLKANYWALFLLFFYIQMTNQSLIDASSKGDIESVRSILSQKKISVNCMDIWLLIHGI